MSSVLRGIFAVMLALAAVAGVCIILIHIGRVVIYLFDKEWPEMEDWSDYFACGTFGLLVLGVISLAGLLLYEIGERIILPTLGL